jgi:uncharacterized repeat protein (TIGR03803 family)
MKSLQPSIALACALGITGCSAASLGGAPVGPESSGVSALPSTSNMLRFKDRGHGLSSGDPMLYNFEGDPDGSDPVARLADVGGTLYGTTYYGGANNLGAVFSVTPSGSEKVIHSFAGSDGDYPEGGLVNVNGTLYGTTSGGAGSNSYGNVYSITPSGAFQVVYSFKGFPNDGYEPADDLTYAAGALYGTTEGGGNTTYGTVFKIQLTGKNRGQESIVYNFQGTADGGPDGARPLAGVVYRNGLLFGTTYSGGAKGLGTLFSISVSSGAETILHSFGATKRDGYEPQGDLVLYKGAFYGTAAYGGGSKSPECGDNCGTVFKIGAGGKGYATVYAFDPGNQSEGHEDGLRPVAGLINVNGTFYGTTLASGRLGNGTVFALTPSGSESLVTVLGCPPSCPSPWPSSPAGALIYVNGVLYGTTESTAGGSGDGTVFAIPI